jgi:hypothetical protein
MGKKKSSSSSAAISDNNNKPAAAPAAPAPAPVPALGGRAGNKKDPSTLSNYKEIRCQHLKLQLNVDFARQVLEGSAEHTMQAKEDGVARAVFDTSAGLEVTKAEVDGALLVVWYVSGLVGACGWVSSKGKGRRSFS